MLSLEDMDAINGLLRSSANAWAAGDGKTYGDHFWPDARYVEAPGFRAVGNEMIGRRHQTIFDSFFKNTRIDGDYKREVQPITNEVVLVHGEGNVLFAGESPKKVKPNGLVSMCLLKRDGHWKVIAFQNTPMGKLRTVRFILRYFRSKLYKFMARSR